MSDNRSVDHQSHASERSEFSSPLMVASYDPFGAPQTTLYECFVKILSLNSSGKRVNLRSKKKNSILGLGKGSDGFCANIIFDVDQKPISIQVRDMECVDLGKNQLKLIEVKKENVTLRESRRSHINVSFSRKCDYQYFSKIFRTMIDTYREVEKKVQGENEEEEDEGEEDEGYLPVRNSVIIAIPVETNTPTGSSSISSYSPNPSDSMTSFGEYTAQFASKPFTEWRPGDYVSWTRCIYVQKFRKDKVMTLHTKLSRLKLLENFSRFFSPKGKTPKKKVSKLDRLDQLIRFYEDLKKKKKDKKIDGNSIREKEIIPVLKNSFVRNILKFEIALLKVNKGMFFLNYYELMKKKLNKLKYKVDFKALTNKLLGTSLRSVWDADENRDNIFSFLLFTRSLDSVIREKEKDFYDQFFERLEQIEEEEEEREKEKQKSRVVNIEVSHSNNYNSNELKVEVLDKESHRKSLGQEVIMEEIDLDGIEDLEVNINNNNNIKEEEEDNNNNDNELYSDEEEYDTIKMIIDGREETIQLKKEPNFIGQRDYDLQITRNDIQHLQPFLEEYNRKNGIFIHHLSLEIEVERRRYLRWASQEEEIRRKVAEKYEKMEKIKLHILQCEEKMNNNNEDEDLEKRIEKGRLALQVLKNKPISPTDVEYINFSEDEIKTEIFPNFAFGGDGNRRKAIKRLLKSELSKISETKYPGREEVPQDSGVLSFKDLVVLKTKLVISRRSKNAGITPLQSYGMRLLWSDSIRFGPYHAGILIGNVNFNWYSDGTVHIRHLSDTQRWEDLISLDCFSPTLVLSSSRSLWELIDKIADEVVSCNTSKSYAAYNIFGMKNSLNCHEFSMKLLSILGYNDFEGVAKRYLENLKNFSGAGRSGESLRYLKLNHCSKKFRKLFKEIWEPPKKKKKKNIIEEEDEMMEKLWNRKKNQLEFTSHAQLDKFYIRCVGIDFMFPCNYPSIYRLLKGFDRAFGMMCLQKEYQTGVRDVSLLPCSQGCPFGTKDEVEEEKGKKISFSEYFKEQFLDGDGDQEWKKRLEDREEGDTVVIGWKKNEVEEEEGIQKPQEEVEGED